MCNQFRNKSVNELFNTPLGLDIKDVVKIYVMILVIVQ